MSFHMVESATLLYTLSSWF